MTTLTPDRSRQPILAVALITLALMTPMLQMVARPWLESTFSFPLDRFFSLWVFWIVTLVVLGVSWTHEGLLPSTFGIKRGEMALRGRLIELILAVICGVFLAIVVVFPSQWLREVLNAPPLPSFNPERVIPFWVAAPAWVTAALFEEVLFRSYPIERLSLLGMPRWVAGCLTLVAFSVLHLLAWDWVHVLTVVLPAGAMLTVFYLWRRSLLFVVVIHGIVNFPLLVLPFIAPYLA
jgi:membrane protease YdiL (CAAX protease family)